MRIRTVIRDLLLLVSAVTIFVGSLILIVSADDISIYAEVLLYTLLCTGIIFPPLLLLVRYRRRMWRPLLAALFLVVVNGGSYAGGVVAASIVEGEMTFWLQGIGFSILAGLFIFTPVGGYFFLRDELEYRIRAQQQAEIDREHAKQHELNAKVKSLQAKLDPHFLFNCLNTVAALIGEDPPRAEDYVVKLADVYRRVLSISERTYIPLGEELDLVRDYVDLERQRFGESLTLEITCPEALRSWPISGLLIEPLVENAVKHNRGVPRLHVELEVCQTDGHLIITVRDDGIGFAAEAPARGFGLRGIRERSNLLYGGDHYLDIASTPDQGSTVTLRLPVKIPGVKR